MPAVSSFYPPVLSAESVRLTNALLVRAASFHGTLSGEVTFTATVSATPPQFTPAVLFSVLMNGRAWSVALSLLDCLALHPIFASPEIHDTDIRPLPDELKTALTETLFAPLFARLTEIIGGPVSLETADYHAGVFTAAAGFTVTVSRERETRTVVVGLTPSDGAALTALTTCLAKLPRRHDGFLTEATGRIPVTFSVTAGFLDLRCEDVTRLTPGDVLFPTLWLPKSDKALVTLRSGRHPLGTVEASLSGKTLQLNDSFPAKDTAAMAELEKLDVRLTFELEERTLTVDDLKSLVPGYTFTLTTDADSPVTIRANGLAVARGRLVDVGGTLGVQITDKA